MKTTKLPKTKPAAKASEQLVTDGKDYAANMGRRRTLADVWGYKLSRYDTGEESVYLAQLDKMNKLDLQRECLRVTLHPHDNRETMNQRLLREFRNYIAAAETPVSEISGKPHPKTQEISQRVKDILSGNSRLV